MDFFKHSNIQSNYTRMKNTLLFSLLLCTALSCSGNSTTNSTSDSDSLNSEGTPDPARATDDEPEEVASPPADSNAGRCMAWTDETNSIKS